MNPEADVSVSDEGNLLFNAPMVAELAVLKESSSREAKRKCLELAKKPGMGDAFLRNLPDAFDIPATAEEKYVRALAIVRKMGKAAGREMWEKGYDGDMAPYMSCFWQGLSADRGNVKVIGTKSEKLFHECGYMSLDIVASAVFPDDRPKDGEVVEMANRIMEAFSEGVKSCLA